MPETAFGKRVRIEEAFDFRINILRANAWLYGVFADSDRLANEFPGAHLQVRRSADGKRAAGVAEVEVRGREEIQNV